MVEHARGSDTTVDIVFGLQEQQPVARVRRGGSTPNSLHVATTENVLRATIGVHARRNDRSSKVSSGESGRARSVYTPARGSRSS